MSFADRRSSARAMALVISLPATDFFSGASPSGRDASPPDDDFEQAIAATARKATHDISATRRSTICQTKRAARVLERRESLTHVPIRTRQSCGVRRRNAHALDDEA